MPITHNGRKLASSYDYITFKLNNSQSQILHVEHVFFKVERDEDIQMWSGRELHTSKAGRMKKRKI